MPKYRVNVEPLPVPTPVTQPFWEGTRRHRLMLQRCDEGHVFFYPRSHCPRCLSNRLEWAEASGRGTLYSYTVARRPTSPDFEEDVPFVIAVVELDEGPRMTSRLVEVDLDRVEIGMRLEVVFDDVTEEVTLPYFRPAAG